MQPSDREPVTSQRHTSEWLSSLRGWLSRILATPRGRGAVVGSALAALAATALAIMFVAGAFNPKEQARDPAAPSPSEEPRSPDPSSPGEPVEVPVDADL